MKLRLLSFLILIFLSSSCATLFSNGPDKVTFTTNPAGAEVLLGNEVIGTTPFTHTFKRDSFKEKFITVRKPGHETQTFRLGKAFNAVAVLNLSSLSSWATDILTGAFIEYSPNSYYLELKSKKKVQSSDKEKRAIQFVLVNHHQLTKDIARKDGTYLQTLAKLLEIEKEDYPLFLSELEKNQDQLLQWPYAYHFYLDIKAIHASIM